MDADAARSGANPWVAAARGSVTSGDLVRQARTRLHLTPAALAARAGVFRETVEALEKNDRTPNAETVVRISDALRSTPEALGLPPPPPMVAARVRRELTAAQLAAESGIPYSRIRKIESRGTRPQREYATRIAAVLRTTVEALWGPPPAPPPPPAAPHVWIKAGNLYIRSHALLPDTRFPLPPAHGGLADVGPAALNNQGRREGLNVGVALAREQARGARAQPDSGPAEDAPLVVTSANALHKATQGQSVRVIDLQRWQPGLDGTYPQQPDAASRLPYRTGYAEGVQFGWLLAGALESTAAAGRSGRRGAATAALSAGEALRAALQSVEDGTASRLPANASVGERVEHARRELGLSPEGLAKRANIQVATVNAVEDNTRTPKAETVARISNALETTPEALGLRSPPAVVLARVALNMSAVDVATAAGVTTSMMSQIESNRSRPGAEKADRIAEVLGTTADALWGPRSAPAPAPAGQSQRATSERTASGRTASDRSPSKRPASAPTAPKRSTSKRKAPTRADAAPATGNLPDVWVKAGGLFIRSRTLLPLSDFPPPPRRSGLAAVAARFLGAVGRRDGLQAGVALARERAQADGSPGGRGNAERVLIARSRGDIDAATGEQEARIVDIQRWRGALHGTYPTSRKDSDAEYRSAYFEGVQLGWILAGALESTGAAGQTQAEGVPIATLAAQTAIHNEFQVIEGEAARGTRSPTRGTDRAPGTDAAQTRQREAPSREANAQTRRPGREPNAQTRGPGREPDGPSRGPGRGL